jgi:hypothetical protein
VIEPRFPKAGNGRPPIGLERMLRIHLLQHWFNLADNAVEEALYDITSPAPLRWHRSGRGARARRDHVLEVFGTCWTSTIWARSCLPKSARWLQANGFQVKTGTIVDATLIGTPSSTKNADMPFKTTLSEDLTGQAWPRLPTAHSTSTSAYRSTLNLNVPRKLTCEKCAGPIRRSQSSSIPTPSSLSPLHDAVHSTRVPGQHDVGQQRVRPEMAAISCRRRPRRGAAWPP